MLILIYINIQVNRLLAVETDLYNCSTVYPISFARCHGILFSALIRFESSECTVSRSNKMCSASPYWRKMFLFPPCNCQWLILFVMTSWVNCSGFMWASISQWGSLNRGLMSGAWDGLEVLKVPLEGMGAWEGRGVSLGLSFLITIFCIANVVFMINNGRDDLLSITLAKAHFENHPICSNQEISVWKASYFCSENGIGHFCLKLDLRDFYVINHGFDDLITIMLSAGTVPEPLRMSESKYICLKTRYFCHENAIGHFCLKPDWWDSSVFNNGFDDLIIIKLSRGSSRATPSAWIEEYPFKKHVISAARAQLVIFVSSLSCEISNMICESFLWSTMGSMICLPWSPKQTQFNSHPTCLNRIISVKKNMFISSQAWVDRFVCDQHWVWWSDYY